MNISDFQAAVAAKVGSVNGTVLERVVDHYAEQEATRRVPLILGGLAEVDTLTKGLGRFKSTKQLNADGSVFAEFWTPGDLEGLKKHKDTLKKWEEALNKAIDGADYGELEKLVKSKGDKGQSPKDAAS